MAGKHQHHYPPDDEIVEAFARLGTLAQVAKSYGVKSRTFQSYVSERPGLADRLNEVRRRELEPGADNGVSDLEIAQQRIRELEAALKARREVDIGQERMLRRLEDAARTATPLYRPRKPSRSKRQEEHEFALLFSDTHASEVVRAEETLGMNSYDWDVMLKRMERLRHSVLSYQEHRPYPVRKLHVWMLGDLLSGDVHEELSETNDRPGAEACVQFATDTARWLQEFVPHFERIEVTSVPGNHPRAKKKPQAKQAHNNADWIAAHIMRIALQACPSISFTIPEGNFATTTVAQNWRALLLHGDGVRSSMPGVPWGGVVRRVTTLEQQFSKAKQPIDYVALGHFHTANTLDGVGVKTFLNGSVKGLDEYSLKQFGSGRAPSQLLLTFHPKRGFTDASMIDLVDQQPAGQ